MNVLLAVLGIFVAVVVVAMLLVLIAVLLGMRSLRRRNRVSPEVATDAPLTWLASPVTAARLHRRLHAAVSVSRMIADRHAGEQPPGPVVAMAAALERQAVALDHHLTVVARLAPRVRRPLVPELTTRVNEVEQLVSRLSVLDAQSAAEARLPTQRSAMEDLAEQLDHLEASRREIDQLERAVGLGSPPSMPAASPEATPTEPHQQPSPG